jgi:hypothetical protein
MADGPWLMDDGSTAERRAVGFLDQPSTVNHQPPQ